MNVQKQRLIKMGVSPPPLPLQEIKITLKTNKYNISINIYFMLHFKFNICDS